MGAPKKLMSFSSLVFLFILLLKPKSILGANDRRPNILVILADDLGIGDLGCYGNTTINTPNIDRLAAEGVKLTHHLAAAPMCTPSRAAMITGRYPARYGLVPDETLRVPVIMHVASTAGLPLNEVTLATALRAANYTTAIVGKWHLGSFCSLFGLSCPGPLNHGFQTWYGIPVTLFMEFRGPYDFWIFPTDEPKFQALAVTWLVSIITMAMMKRKLKWTFFSFILKLILTHLILFVVWFKLAHVSINKGCYWAVSSWMHRYANSMLLRQDKVVEKPIELDGLSQRLVSESTEFLAEHAKDDQPFFLFHSMAHVHTPMFNSPSRTKRSAHGRYGDNVEEMDESVGAILKSLKEFGLEDNTIVYFTSDQGGHLEAIDFDGQRIGGHNGKFNGGKCQGGSEGGIRVAGIYRWPGHLPAGTVIDTPTSLMDLMPTVLELADLPPVSELIPQDTTKDIDGQSIAEILVKGDALQEETEERIFIHHCQQAIHALRLVKGEHVYKMYNFKHIWGEGSTQCGWGHTVGCKCYGDTILNLTDNPELFDLSVDPYEEKEPINPNTDEYKEVVTRLQNYLKDWQKNVYYSPSQLSSPAKILWNPFYQPHMFN